MNKVFDALTQYGLHDTKIDRIILEGNSIVFEFDNGVYDLSASGQEVALTGKCSLKITVGIAINAELENYVDIRRLFKNRINELTIKELTGLADKHYLDVHNLYFSVFNSEVLIVGGIGKYGIEIYISDILQAEYIFN